MSTTIAWVRGADPGRTIPSEPTLAPLGERRIWPNTNNPALVISRQRAFGLVQQNQIVAEGVANPRASANRDVERTLHRLAARA